MKKFNGHRSWNAWNVSLWITSDEYLNFIINDMVQKGIKKRLIVRKLLAMLDEKTPDGAKYNALSVGLVVDGYLNG